MLHSIGSFGFLFSFLQTFLSCIGLSPEHTLQEDAKGRKKQAVTFVTLSVSLLFGKQQHLNYQEYKQKRCRIRLQTYDKEECPNRI